VSQAQEPAASLLLVAYDHEAFIEAALLSALRQDLEDFELVVVDDASRDRTRDIITAVLARERREGLRIKTIFHERNQGLLAAVNAAMAAASGRIFVTMAGDDISAPDRLRRTLRVFAAAPEVQLVYGEVEIIDERSAVLRPAPSAGEPRRFAYSDSPYVRIYGGAFPCGASAAYRRRLFDVFGPMVPGSHAEDNCYWVRALLLGQVHHDPACYIRWRQHANNLSNYHAGDGEAWRARHLAWMEKHAGMSAQWLTDLALARGQGLVSAWRAFWIGRAARREDAAWSLEVASLRADPWAEWLRRARSLLQAGRVSTVIRMLGLRVSRSRREKRWQVLAKLKSNAAV